MTKALDKQLAAFAAPLRRPALCQWMERQPAAVVRSPTAAAAGISSGSPQCERERVDMVTLCAATGHDETRQ